MPVAPVWHRLKRSVDVAPMTAYEIISISIGILALLMSFGREILERRMMKELDLLYTTNVEADI